jgi:hypothetical protein
MKNLTYKVVLIALVDRKRLIKEGIFDNSVAALGTHEEVRVRRVASECDLAIGKKRIELSIGLKSDLAGLKRLVPITEAVMADG